ncbi:hypothetical protein CLOM_g159 [Closterium sp. NIES-68]|nr:hypothetical protein CLOM_g159 [Closterium sp. NIES-68]GJP68094.1 hypothetical protein CLOP_g24841 [Closterium sp. NIES-67]
MAARPYLPPQSQRPPQFWRPGAPRPGESLASRASLAVDADGADADVSIATLASPFAQSGRERLPVCKHREGILYLVETHAVTVVVGETGSGKTTQIPQYLVEAGWAAGGRVVACTQPRRVAAQMVAGRVAEEMGVALGERVGYSIRFENVTMQGVTQIKFLTDGVLLREMMEDPLLSRYSVIMVDEAHERSLATDILLGLLKKVLRRRPDLRLVISSATLAADDVAAFFDTSHEKPKVVLANAPSRKPAIISVEGRSHPVQLLYLEEATSDYLQSALDTVLAIHCQEPPGDILVFLTGQEEVDTLVQLIAEHSNSYTPSSEKLRDLQAFPLYAGLPAGDIEAAFAPTLRGRRKVLVATNIAETSLTIEGIVYVVDCGFVKQRFFDPVSNVDALLLVPVSRASAQQRAGRAGRVRPGKCYRLYTEHSYMTDLAAHTIPEIQRSDLTATVLQLKSLGIDNIMRFDWLSPPAPAAMIRALETLFAVRAMDMDGRLTKPVGVQLAELPLDPLVAVMLLVSANAPGTSAAGAAGSAREGGGGVSGKEEEEEAEEEEGEGEEADGCSEEMCTVAASLCVQSVWVGSGGRQRESDRLKERFAAAEGDFVSYLNVYEGFIRSGQSSKWCHANGINYQAMLRVADVRGQLRRGLRRLGLKLLSCRGDVMLVQRAAAASLFVNAAQLMTEGDGSTYKSVRGNLHLKIHPSSVLFRVAPQWVVYRTASQADSLLYMRDVTVVEKEWLLDAAPHLFTKRQIGIPTRT